MNLALPYIKGDTLDFGAGNAKYKPLIITRASHYTAFDVKPGPHVDVVGDAMHPPFADSSFDTIISTQVLEHVERPWIMAKEIARLTRPGGMCIVTAPFIVPYHSDPYDFFRYTKEGLASLFTNEGFELVESGSYSRVFSVFSEMIHFSFFSPYEKKKKGLWSVRFMRYLERLAYFLDGLLSRDGAIYANSFVIVRKK